MKLSELHQIVNRSYDPSRPHDDSEVVIRVRLPFTTVGAMPTVGVKQGWQGIDWERGKFILEPVEQLAPSDREFDVKFRELQEQLGRVQLENRDLKRRIKRLSENLES